MHLKKILSNLEKPDYLLKESEKNNEQKFVQKNSLFGSAIKFFLILISSALVLTAGFFGGRIYDTYKKVVQKNDGINFFSGTEEERKEKITLNGEGSGRINILMLGYGGEDHEGGYLTDTIMIGSLDPVNFTATALSIPRDLTINYDQSFCTKGYQGKREGKINEIYPVMRECNRSLKEEEIEERANKTLKNAVGNFLDININYIVKINFQGFVDGIDAIGGIKVCPEQTLIDSMYPNEKTHGYQYLKILGGTDANGEQICHQMDGELALKYARSRYSTSDFDRAKRQQEIIMAGKEKVSQIDNFLSLSFIEKMLDILGENIKTDFESIEHIKKLAEIGLKINSSTIATHVLSNSPDSFLVDDWTNGYHLYPKDRSGKEIQKFVKTIFDEPFIKKENAKILVLNGTNISGLAGTMSEILSENGYNILGIATSEEKYNETILLAKKIGVKKYTEGFLETRLKTETKTLVSAEVMPTEFILPKTIYDLDGKILEKISISEIDFIIIVGNDFV